MGLRFERYGSDNHRTLINRFFTSSCWTGLAALVAIL
jgi:hypothetical protein